MNSDGMAIKQVWFGPLRFSAGSLAPHKTNENLGNLSNVLYVILHKPTCCIQPAKVN